MSPIIAMTALAIGLAAACAFTYFISEYDDNDNELTDGIKAFFACITLLTAIACSIVFLVTSVP